MLDSEPRSFRIAAWVILGLSALLFLIQLQSLQTFPIADSVRWGGDETWLMREFGNQARTGVMSYPESYDGTVRTDGVLAGSMWVESLLYGVTGNALTPRYTLVEIGRWVTAVLSLVLLLTLYFSSRAFGVSRVFSSFGVLFVASSMTFVIATHSARYDVLTGLSLLGFLYLLSATVSTRVIGGKLFILSCMSVLVIIFSRHLLTLTIPVTLLWMFRQRVWDSASRIFISLGGVWLSGLLLICCYAIPAGEFSLFGSGGGFGSYDFVLKQLPILRPFSRSVQLGNLLERYDLLSREAPAALIAVLTAGLVVLSYLLWKAVLALANKPLRMSTRVDQRFFLSAAGLAALTWLLLQGARPYYAMHIVPVLLVAAVIVFEWLQNTFELSKLLQYPIPGLFVLFAVLQLPAALKTHELGSAITKDQRAAIDRFANLTPRATVLADVAGLNWALQHGAAIGSHVQTLDMFQPPQSDTALGEKLHKNHIDYIILRSSPVASAFEPGRAHLPIYLSTHATVVDSALGLYYDDGRSYDSSLEYALRQGLDTLRLYRLNFARP